MKIVKLEFGSGVRRMNVAEYRRKMSVTNDSWMEDLECLHSGIEDLESLHSGMEDLECLQLSTLIIMYFIIL